VKYYASNQTSKHFGAKLSITIQLVKLVKRSSCKLKPIPQDHEQKYSRYKNIWVTLYLNVPLLRVTCTSNNYKLDIFTYN